MQIEPEEVRREFIRFLVGDRRRSMSNGMFLRVGVVLNSALLLYLISQIG